MDESETNGKIRVFVFFLFFRVLRFRAGWLLAFALRV